MDKITLTNVVGAPMRVNVAHIVTYWKSYDDRYTQIVLTEMGLIPVVEEPEVIDSLLIGIGASSYA